MKIRLISTVFLCALVVSALATIPSAHAQKVLKLASFVPPIYVLHKPIFLKLAADLKAATNGSVNIKVYPSGELGKGPLEQYQRAVKRIAEISYGLQGYTSPLFPRNLLVELPGVADNPEDATRKIWKVMDKYLRAEYRGTRPLAAFATAPAVIMSSTKPVHSPSDMKGMKIRVPSKSAAAVVKAYGATPVLMPATKVYTSMSTGVVDGALMGADSLLIFKLIEPTKFVTTGLPEMVTEIYLTMNQKAYDELSASEKAALDNLTGKGLSLRASKGLENFGKKALAIFGKGKGKKIISLTPVNRKKFDALANKAVTDLVKEFESKGVPASKIIAAMKY
ncbi:MAG: TRAP transporter substrate-binding protein [Dehalococcoidia bacterium]|nr:TRAP transporter substrate-binding protein [Dehalococcoidia bacterium]